MKKPTLPLLRLFFSTALGAMLLCIASSRIQAQTLDVYVNSSTWAYSTHGGTGTLWSGPVTAQSQTWPNETRRYYGGEFDTVIIRSHVSPFTILQMLTNCYNVFYTSGTTAYRLSNGYNGSGNGVDGAIFSMAAAYNGDLYIGGDFALAGGYSHANNFSCYRFHNGWSGVNEVEVNDVVTSVTWDNYRLLVQGWFTEVHGPITSGGSVYNYISVGGYAYWNDFWANFPAAYWSQN